MTRHWLGKLLRISYSLKEKRKKRLNDARCREYVRSKSAFKLQRKLPEFWKKQEWRLRRTEEM